MADNQTTVALNIGSQRIGMAVFEVSKSGSLLITAYGSETIVADPALDSSKISLTSPSGLKSEKAKPDMLFLGSRFSLVSSSFHRYKMITSSSLSPLRHNNMYLSHCKKSFGIMS
jgi:hypothetical protein